MLRLDHLAVACADLDAGAAWVKARLGVAPEGGGRHARLGTWNRLLSLGDCYLEVIAVDPSAPPPGRRRWFGLDDFNGAPRLAGVVLENPGLTAAGPEDEVLALSRDALTWTMALPRHPQAPALIDWGDTVPPPARLPDHGLRLIAATAPQVPPGADPRLTPGPFGATIATPAGPRQL